MVHFASVEVCHQLRRAAAKTRGCHVKTLPGPIPTCFGAVSKLISVPRDETKPREASAPAEKISKHKRYEYVPAAPPSKP